MIILAHIIAGLFVVSIIASLKEVLAPILFTIAVFAVLSWSAITLVEHYK